MNLSTPRPEGRGLLEVHPEPRLSTPPLKAGLRAAEWVKEPSVKEPAVKEPAAKEVLVKEPPGAGGRGGLKELIPILQDILSRVEKLVDGVSRKGTFLKEFKRSLIEKSGEYPFLDPFAGEFEYREGTIGFKGEAGAKDFAKGIGECLQATLNHLEEKLPKNKMLPAKMRAEVESFLEHYREGMKRLGVDAVLGSIFQ